MNKFYFKKIDLLQEYKDILTIKDVKEILGIGKNKAYELVNSGTIPSFKVGIEYRITKTNLLNYINRTTN